MSTGEMHWVLITDAPASLDWPDNHLLDLEVDGKKITLAKFKDGYLGQVVCPLHRYAFDMKNGRNTTGEGYFLKTYPIELRPEGIFIGFKPNSFF
jgi:3-phenylpropionate/trans-cinnamate dioxygenase ferredoxin subunit